MSKRVKMTPQIEAYIRAGIGNDSADVSKFAVFEAKSLSTEAIKKPGFYNGARMSASTLNDMAKLVNTPSKALPLQVMHENDLLPVGRVFRGTVQPMENGETQLNTLFYIPEDKPQFINDIENSVIDEVSVGLLNNHAFCSECDFDYLGADASFTNFYTLTCANEHTIGEDGVHLRLVGVKDWAELSLVNRGAAKDAKILSRAKQVLGSDAVSALAASGGPVDARLVTVTHKLEASASGDKHKGEFSMDAKELMAQLSANAEVIATSKVELAAAVKERDTLKAQVTELTASVSAKDAEIVTLKKTAPETAAALEAAAATEKKLSDATAKLLPHAKAALTASGVAEANMPTDLTAMLALVEEKGIKLHQLFAAGAVTDGTKEGAEQIEKTAQFRSEAFKLNSK